MSKKLKKTSDVEQKDDGLKGANCTYFPDVEYKWIGDDRQGYYQIGDMHPCRMLDFVYTTAQLNLSSVNEAKYRKRFFDACWYWLTPDIARAWLDRLIDELGVLLWNAQFNDAKLAGLPEREWQTKADKALETYRSAFPTAMTIFDKPKGRR